MSSQQDETAQGITQSIWQNDSLLRLDRVDDGMAWESADVERIERFPKIGFAACIFPSADRNV
ncbi:hypothetical protein E5D57_011882 [Metarhizium anisopliae]|nr:hypothetical protein E5D57_011882 [Metarhizium anisopliae]